LRARKQIAPFEGWRNRICLNRCGPDESEVFDAAQQIGVELELSERHPLVSLITLSYWRAGLMVAAPRS
jgi:hypothetical protein